MTQREQHLIKEQEAKRKKEDIINIPSKKEITKAEIDEIERDLDEIVSQKSISAAVRIGRQGHDGY